VIVTHDAQLASWADRVVYIRDRLIADQMMPKPDPDARLERDR
jgi:putative ABC transport system ATP-binding protein